MLSRVLSSQAPPIRSRRGFTLLELLVAIVAGLFVAMAAFALSKQSSRFFHQETRLANAQFETLVGFERLRADIARAGYLSTANIQTEPFHCISPNVGNWPKPLSMLSAMYIPSTEAGGEDEDEEPTPPGSGFYFAGSYTANELFPVRAIQSGAGDGDRIILNPSFGPLARVFQRGMKTGEYAPVETQGPILQDIFTPGRAIRVLDQSGSISFGVINQARMEGTNPVVVLERTTPLPFLAGGGRCGIAGNETGAQVSVINWIRYDLEEMDADRLEGIPGSEGALQLVRREIDFMSADLNSPNFIGLPETVAEFAVDLKIGLTYLQNTASPLNPQLNTLATLAPGHATIPSIARDVTLAGGVRGPEHIRSIRARLSVRSREGDRRANIAPFEDHQMLFRYELSDGSFARVRTMGADIQLPNLSEVVW